jgi:hypothetical protein
MDPSLRCPLVPRTRSYDTKISELMTLSQPILLEKFLKLALVLARFAPFFRPPVRAVAPVSGPDKAQALTGERSYGTIQ